MISRASGSDSSKPLSAASARYHLERQLRQNPARFIRSIFWTSVCSRRWLTSFRNAAASISVCDCSGIGVVMIAHTCLFVVGSCYSELLTFSACYRKIQGCTYVQIIYLIEESWPSARLSM